MPGSDMRYTKGKLLGATSSLAVRNRPPSAAAFGGLIAGRRPIAEGAFGQDRNAAAQDGPCVIDDAPGRVPMQAEPA